MFGKNGIVFWLVAAIQSINALNAAAPYEIVLLYYAYKMEYLTTEPGSRVIAPDCSHRPYLGNQRNPAYTISVNIETAAKDQGIQGICSFAEFLQHVGVKAWASALKNKIATPNPRNEASIKDPLTQTLDPNPDRLAAAVNDPATIGSYKLMTDQSHLFSTSALASMLHGASSGNIPWAEQLEKVSNVIERARVEMAKRIQFFPVDTTVIRLSQTFQKWVDDATDNMRTLRAFRVGDYSRFLVPAQRNHISWTSSPMATHGVTSTVRYENLDGSPSKLLRKNPAPEGPPLIADTNYQVVDFEASFQDAKNAGAPLRSEQKEALNTFAATYGTVAGSIEKAHRDIIDTIKYMMELHTKPIILDSNGNCVTR